MNKNVISHHSKALHWLAAQLYFLLFSPRFSSLRELLLRASVLLADGDGMIIQSLSPMSVSLLDVLLCGINRLADSGSRHICSGYLQ